MSEDHSENTTGKNKDTPHRASFGQVESTIVLVYALQGVMRIGQIVQLGQNDVQNLLLLEYETRVNRRLFVHFTGEQNRNFHVFVQTIILRVSLLVNVVFECRRREERK